MKKLSLFLTLALSATGVFAADEMLSNPGFEESSYNAIFQSTTFTDWTTGLGMATAETTDKIEGEQ